jgi:hypothetical protein
VVGGPAWNEKRRPDKGICARIVGKKEKMVELHKYTSTERIQMKIYTGTGRR